MSGALDRMTPEEDAELRRMQDDEVRQADEASALPPLPEAGHPQPGEQAAEQHPAEPEFVDKRALVEERDRRRETEKKLREVEQKSATELAKVQTRLDMLVQAAQAQLQAQAPPPPAPPAVEVPDFNTGLKVWRASSPPGSRVSMNGWARWSPAPGIWPRPGRTMMLCVICSSGAPRRNRPICASILTTVLRCSI